VAVDDLDSQMSSVVSWLLEPASPSARFLALTELLDRPLTDRDVMAARAAIPDVDPARSILDAQFSGTGSTGGPAGYWIKPDVGYSPKYRATVWQVIFLAQLGAPPIEPVRRACEYVLDHSRRLADRRGNPDGRFVAGKGARTAVNCLNGNLLWALGRLGYAEDPRTIQAREATARAIVQHSFACYYNADLPCAWGGIKALRALLEIPGEERSASVRQAIHRGIDLLLSAPLLQATYPTSGQVSQRWFQLGFPLDYRADVLEAMLVLAEAGYAEHPALQGGAEWLSKKQDDEGRWRLERVPGKMWASFGRPGEPNKWVTLRALRMLKAIGRLESLPEAESGPSQGAE
jgi:hypothetical protein